MAGKRHVPPDQLVNKRGGRYTPLQVYAVVDGDESDVDRPDDDEGETRPIPPPPDDVVRSDITGSDGTLIAEDADAYAVEVWRAFWMSPVSRLADIDAHGEALRHWIRLVHQRTWLWESYRKQPLVLGSKNQPMTNPIWRQVRELSAEIATYEEAFGMTPLAQLRLGVEFLTGQALQASLKTPARRHRPQLANRDA